MNSEDEISIDTSGLAFAKKSLKYLFYLEYANAHRSRVVARLARALVACDHEVAIGCEESLAFKLGLDREIQVEKNEAHLQREFLPEFQAQLRIIDLLSGDERVDLKQANALRQERLADLIHREKPDHVILWGGKYPYQEGSLEALRDAGLLEGALFIEDGWLSHGDQVCLSPSVVSVAGQRAEGIDEKLTNLQQIVLDGWKERLRFQRFGNQPPAPVPKRALVLLEEDMDASIVAGSPFATMAEFLSFLEKWVPADYDVTVRMHPRASYPYLLTPTRLNFRVLATGSLDEQLASAEVVIGLQGPVLLEAAALGCRTVAFGRGLFAGTGAVIEATAESDPVEIFAQKVDATALDAFLYRLAFCKLLSLTELDNGNYRHLAHRMPFNQHWESEDGQELLALNAEEGKSMIKIGKSKIAKSACLDVERGGQITIGNDCEVRHHAVLECTGRYNGSIEIGNHSVIGVSGWLQGSGKIKIGDDVIIGPYVAIVSTNHTFENPEIPVANQPLQTGEVVIENDVWIGAHCTIAWNVRIGAHSIIGANSFVNKDVPPYSIVAGAPAKILKSRKS